MSILPIVGRQQPLHRQTGMTLVEIMIALLIGAFLLGGVLQIFINTRQSYRMQENLSRLQENGRFAMEFISRDLRMAGYMGCASLGSLTPNFIATPQNPPNSNPAVNPLTALTAIVGSNNIANNWSTAACSASNQCVANTDAVTIQYGGSCDGYLTGNMGTNNANIQISAANTCNIKQYDTVLISDCSAADVFIDTSNDVPNAVKQTIAHAQNQNSDNKLSKVYGPDAEVFVFRTYSYFIRTGASGQPALWRLNNSKAADATNPVELLEGIENIQILYGEDTDADGAANYYVPANSVVNLANVISMRINVLVVTPDDNIASQPRAYTFNGTTTTPTDRRLRRVFTSTLAVRNRLN
jgi:type IV pilus assembly protein PilW